MITVAPAAAILFVLSVWALVRGELAAEGDGATPAPLPVMLLLLSLALTVIVLEVLVYNPYQAALARDRREVRRLLSADRGATDALTVHDIAWRNLRSSQDEVISFIRAELARPWHTVILPARLRHGRAGPRPGAAGVRSEGGDRSCPCHPRGSHRDRPCSDHLQVLRRSRAAAAKPRPSGRDH